MEEQGRVCRVYVHRHRRCHRRAATRVMSNGTGERSSMSLTYRALRYDLVQAAIHDGVWSSVDCERLVKMKIMKKQEVGLELSLEQAMLKSPHESSLVKPRDVTSEGRRRCLPVWGSSAPSLRLSLASFKGLDM